MTSRVLVSEQAFASPPRPNYNPQDSVTAFAFPVMKVPASALYRDPFPPSPHSLSGVWIMDSLCFVFWGECEQCCLQHWCICIPSVCASIHAIDMALNVGKNSQYSLAPLRSYHLSEKTDGNVWCGCDQGGGCRSQKTVGTNSRGLSQEEFSWCFWKGNGILLPVSLPNG